MGTGAGAGLGGGVRSFSGCWINHLQTEFPVSRIFNRRTACVRDPCALYGENLNDHVSGVTHLSAVVSG